MSSVLLSSRVILSSRLIPAWPCLNLLQGGRGSKSMTHNLIMNIESIIKKRIMKASTHNLIMSIESIIKKRVMKSSTYNLIMST